MKSVSKQIIMNIYSIVYFKTDSAPSRLTDCYFISRTPGCVCDVEGSYGREFILFVLSYFFPYSEFISPSKYN